MIDFEVLRTLVVNPEPATRNRRRPRIRTQGNKLSQTKYTFL